MIGTAFLATFFLQNDLEQLRDVHRLMQKSEDDLNARRLAPSEEKQREIIDRLKRLIDEARRAGRTPQNDRRADRDARPAPGRGAIKPYLLKPHDPTGVFQSNDARNAWNLHLPPAVREAILHGARDIDEYPEPLRAVLRRWTQAISRP